MNEDLMSRHPDQANAKGGTELMQARLYNSLPRELLEKYQIWFSRYDENQVDPNKLQLLYVYDLPGDPMYNQSLSTEGRKRFKKIIFASNWQQQVFMHFYGLNWSDCLVMRSGIEPFDAAGLAEAKRRTKRDKIRLIYHTTPHRGLEILADIFPVLSARYPGLLELDVFSSFSIYGWPGRDQEYKELFARLRHMDGVRYHGAVSNQTVREYLRKAHIFAYPSIWAETSCMALIEAMSAGCVCVHPNYAVLPETSGGLTAMHPMHEDKTVLAAIHMEYLDNAIRNLLDHGQDLRQQLRLQKAYADASYSWAVRAEEWKALLTKLAGGN